MGIFDRLFGRQPNTKLTEYFQTLNCYQPRFTTVNGGLYEAEITRSAIHSIATHCSKLQPVVRGSNNNLIKKRLEQKPNPWQTTSQWLYRTATILAVENNAFIVPILEYATDALYGRTVGYYTVCPSLCEVMEYKGEPWLRYQFQNGQIGAIELRRCAILTNFQYKDEFFGDGNRPLMPTVQLIQTQNEGIAEGIKSSASIRFIGKLARTLQNSDIEAERKRFREDNFSAENNGGVILIDGKYSDLQPITSKPFIVDAEQRRMIENNVYNYFGVNEKILRNEWDETAYTAFYEGKIEPFAIQLGLGLTCMTFTEHERAYGNEVELSSNRLQYATTQTKMSLCANLLDRGVISINEARRLLQMPDVENGDVRTVRGEYYNADEKLVGISEEEGEEQDASKE